MGAQVWEYNFTRPVAEIEAADGSRRPVQNLILVIDPRGRLIRVIENPNPVGPADRRTLLGRPGKSGVAVRFAPRARFLKKLPR